MGGNSLFADEPQEDLYKALAKHEPDIWRAQLEQMTHAPNPAQSILDVMRTSRSGLVSFDNFLEVGGTRIADPVEITVFCDVLMGEGYLPRLLKGAGESVENFKSYARLAREVLDTSNRGHALRHALTKAFPDVTRQFLERQTTKKGFEQAVAFATDLQSLLPANSFHQHFQKPGKAVLQGLVDEVGDKFSNWRYIKAAFKQLVRPLVSPVYNAIRQHPWAILASTLGIVAAPYVTHYVQQATQMSRVRSYMLSDDEPERSGFMRTCVFKADSLLPVGDFPTSEGPQSGTVRVIAKPNTKLQGTAEITTCQFSFTNMQGKTRTYEIDAETQLTEDQAAALRQKINKYKEREALKQAVKNSVVKP